MDKKEFYPHSFDEAKRNNETDIYKESLQANIDCKNAIENIISENYDGQRLGKDLAKKVISDFGYDRVNYVLANTVKQKDWDGRISRENKEWAKETFIPPDKVGGVDNNKLFALDSHTGLTDLFVNQYKREYANLNLWGKSQVNPTGNLDFEGKVMVLKPTVLADEYKTRDDQLFFAIGGFGCRPNARGQKVMGQFLNDGEKVNFYRLDFLGEAKKELLPTWATEKLAEITAKRENKEVEKPSVLGQLKANKELVSKTSKDEKSADKGAI